MRIEFTLGKKDSNSENYIIYNNSWDIVKRISITHHVFINRQGKLVKSKFFYSNDNKNLQFKTKREALKAFKKYFKIKKIINKKWDGCTCPQCIRDIYSTELGNFKTQFDSTDCFLRTELFKYYNIVSKFIKKNFKKIKYQYEWNRIYQT